MRKIISLVLFFATAPSVLLAEEETCVNRQVSLGCATVQQAANAAIAALTYSQRQGRTVDTSRQIVAEGDRICLLQFLSIGTVQAPQFRIEGHWCMRQEGTYDFRRDGHLTSTIIRRTVRDVRSLYDDPNSWQRFYDEVLSRPDGFAAVQHLIRTQPNERARILRLVLRRDAVFFGQNHPDGMISN